MAPHHLFARTHPRTVGRPEGRGKERAPAAGASSVRVRLHLGRLGHATVRGAFSYPLLQWWDHLARSWRLSTAVLRCSSRGGSGLLANSSRTSLSSST